MNKMSCLYDSLSKYVDIGSQDLRAKICDYLDRDPDIAGCTAQQIVEWQANMSLDRYTALMRTNAWGGAIEIKAFCDIYETNVRVQIPDSREIEFISQKKTDRMVCIKWTGNHFSIA